MLTRFNLKTSFLSGGAKSENVKKLSQNRINEK